MRVAAMGRATAAFLQGLCCAFVFLFSCSAGASNAAGVAWLQAQIQGNGSLAQEGASPALPVQSRFEAATTLKLLTSVVAPQLLDAIDAVNDDTTEVLARKVLAKQLMAVTTVYLDALVQKQNADGGFGAAEGYASNAQDTAWALAALTRAASTYSSASSKAVAWFLGVQQPAGSWNLAPDDDPLVATALAVQALQPYRQTTAVAAALGKARSWLLAQRNGGLNWGDPIRNAHALLAVLPGLSDAATVQATVDALRNAQQPDGSWNGDPYTTALALRTSYIANQPVTDPDLASIGGTLVSDAIGAALVGVQVQLTSSGKTTLTDAQGSFEFLQLVPGSDKLAINATGYLSFTVDLSLLKGQHLDLGTISLKAATGGNATTVTITGVAKFTDDGVNYQNAANATVSFGAWTTQTNANGEYTLDGVAPGVIDLKVTYSSYPAVEASFAALAGQQIRLDPVFRRSSTAQSTLKVLVSSQATGAPIAMASVSLNGLTRNTNAKGEASFDTGMAAGDNTVTVSATGFETRIITMNVQGNHSITLPVALTTKSVAPGQTVLQGIVTDAATRLPLQGVAVAVDGTGRTALTDAAGRYSIGGAPDIAGARKVSFEKAGYQRYEQTIALVQNNTHQFDVPLQPNVDTTQPISIQVTVADKTTHQPIAGATITLSGNNPHVVQTNASGVAEISGLNAGATQVQVSAAGYDNTAFSVDLAAGQHYLLPVEMAPQVLGQDRIYGLVLDAQTQRPIAGAKVVLAGGSLHEATTGSDGRYEFTNISPGRWNLSAVASGYQGSSSGFDIGASTAINLALKADYGVDANNSLRAVAVGHPNISSAAVGYLFVFGSKGTTGQVVSNDGAINYSFAIDASGVAELMVPNTQFLNDAGLVVDKAMLVYASKGVSAYFLNREQYTTDMAYLLDASALGLEYRIVDWNHAFSNIQFSLTAIEDGTAATVTPASNLVTGQSKKVPFNVILNKGQSVIYTANSGSEITGTHIQANKPLAVFSGAQCANVPTNVGYCDHLFTQLPPVKHWASHYVVPKTANTGTAGNLVRILANTAATQVRINGTLVATLNAGEFHEVTDAESLYIVASEPILVGQFLKGFNATGSGDPAFSYVVGMDQTLSEYVFTAPTNLSPYPENYLNIAISTSELSSLQLNGAVVDVSAFTPVGTSGYSAGYVAIPTGAGRIKAAKPFVATIAGFSQFDSYLTIIGANYSTGASPIDMVARVNASTDKPSYPADTAVQLRAAASNLGSTPVALKLVLRINDATGVEVARFAQHDLGSVAAGATAPRTQPWNTARYPAGNYTLIATLLNSKGDVVDVGSVLFSITAGHALGSPKATLTVAVDKAEYAPSDQVHISNLARNLTLNTPVDDARVRITVRNPNHAVVYTYTHMLGQLLANGLRSNDAQQPLKTAMEGSYTVEAVLIGSGNNLKSAALAGNHGKAYDAGVELAVATTTYTVRAHVPAVPIGPVAIAPIPINQPWFLWLICAGLAWMARQRLRVRTSPTAREAGTP